MAATANVSPVSPVRPNKPRQVVSSTVAAGVARRLLRSGRSYGSQ